MPPRQDTHQFFVASYPKDFPWLHCLLTSIDRFAAGWLETVVSVDAAHRAQAEREFGRYNCRVVVQSGEPGYLRAQCAMISADEVCEGDIIWIVGSDCLITGPATPDMLMQDGRPVMLFTPYASMSSAGNPGVIWKQGTSDAVGWDVEHEYMRRLPLLYPREVLKRTRLLLGGRHGEWKSYVYGTAQGLENPYHSRFSESNVIGAVAYRHMPGAYVWMNTDTEAGPSFPLVQHWSHGGFERPTDAGVTPRSVIESVLGQTIEQVIQPPKRQAWKRRLCLAISVCHKDASLCLKLMRWIGYLSMVSGDSMRDVTLLLVPSRLASGMWLVREAEATARTIFGRVHVSPPPDHHEVGWPGACNYQFNWTLQCVERFGLGPVLFLEPDAIPTHPDWFDAIEGEYITSDRSFMGAFVDFSIPHMSGVGVYPANWRKMAPKLEAIPDDWAWDVWAGKEILSHCKCTNLIQHVYDKPAIALDRVKRGAVVFHQDKCGDLIPLLDESLFRGACASNKRFSYLTIPEEPRMMKYYRVPSANRPYVAGPYRVTFEPVENIGGFWVGVLAVEDEATQQAIATHLHSVGVTEITAEEYEALAKKKAPVLTPLVRSPQFPQVSLASRDAVVVDGAVEVPADPKLAEVDDIRPLLRTGKAEPVQTPEPPKPKQRAQRKSPSLATQADEAGSENP